MTDNEIFETEIKCINRRSSGKCNGGTDCCKCDLLMDDKDIISAYERAVANSTLINRLQAEIERLRKEVNLVSIQFQDVQERYEEVQTEIEQWKEKANKYQKLWCIEVDDIETAKSEIYKEFAEHLKERWSNNYYDSPDVDFDEFVDNLLKEMVGEE